MRARSAGSASGAKRLNSGAMWSRRHEFQADRFAARHAEARQLVSALVKLYRSNASTLTPDRLYAAVHYSHPPAIERIARLR